MDKISLDRYSINDGKTFSYSPIAKVIGSIGTNSNTNNLIGRMGRTKDRSVEGQGGKGMSGYGIAEIYAYIGETVESARPANRLTLPLLHAIITNYKEQTANLKGVIGNRLLNQNEARSVASRLPRSAFVPLQWVATNMLQSPKIPRRLLDELLDAGNDLINAKIEVRYTNGDTATINVLDRVVDVRSRGRKGLDVSLSQSFIEGAIVKAWDTHINYDHLSIGERDGKKYGLSYNLDNYLSQYENLKRYIENGGYIDLKLPTVISWISDFPTIDGLGVRQSVTAKIITPLTYLLESMERRGISGAVLEKNGEPFIGRCSRSDAYELIVRLQYSPEWIKDLINDRTDKEKKELLKLFDKYEVLQNTQALDVI